VEDERRQLEEETERELDQIVSEYHSKLTRAEAKTIGAIYARYSSRYQHSISDQVRTLFEAGLKLGVFIPREHIFYDMAVRGFKDQRPGLNRLRDLLDKKRVDVFLVFTTNRLFRKTYKALQFVEEEVVERGIRCLFVKSGVDSADEKRWRMLLNIHAMTDEFVVGMYADNIRAAQEGLFDKQLVFGTISYGYKGEPIPGGLTRRNRPRCRITIDEESAHWVRQIFHWFVKDLISISEIVHRLNADESIPLPPKSRNGQWTCLAVRKLLTNTRYRGWWRYGASANVWQSKKDYNRQIARPEPLRAAQFEELRIVDDDVWHAAQKRLQEMNPHKAGRKPKDGNCKSRPKVLNGILWCPVHGVPLYVGGVYGEYMFCKRCKEVRPEDRPLFSHLPRELALRLTCKTLSDLIRRDEALVSKIIQAIREQAGAMQRPDPKEWETLCRTEQRLARQISFIMQHPGETPEDERESAENLRLLRRQRTEVAEQKRRFERGNAIVVPDEQSVRDLLKEMDTILVKAAEGADASEMGRVRDVVTLLTGGRIDLFQQGDRSKQKGWLQGRVSLRLVNCIVQRITQGQQVVGDDAGLEVTIDYKKPWAFAADADRAKEFYDRGLLNTQIAVEMGCAETWVAKLLRYWFKSHRLEMPDGRQRSKLLLGKLNDSAMYKRLADPAHALWDQGLADLQIAGKLGCSPPTVVAAVAYWHESRGLPVPSHVDRRASLVDQMQSLFEQGLLFKEIAGKVDMCSRSVTNLLKERYKALGRPLPDCRTRRGAIVLSRGAAKVKGPCVAQTEGSQAVDTTGQQPTVSPVSSPCEEASETARKPAIDDAA
jgi:predicted site-specific integrase-resolvase